MLHSILTIGGSLTLLMLCIAIFFFFGYVQSLNVRVAAVRERVPEAFAVYHVPPADPDAAVRAIVRQVYSIGLRVVAFNDREKVIASAASPGAAGSTIFFERVPNERERPVARNLSERLILGLATALGFQAQHFLLNGVTVEINVDPAALTRIVWRFGFVLLGLLAIIGLFAYVAAKLLNREALRPLEEVVAALDALGSGDLTPRPVEAATKDEFGRLAAAYNGAVEQVIAAFGERDRAEGEIRRFIADAAHQLRTPLTVIQGFIGILLKNDLKAQEDRERILWSMDRQSRSMASLIEKLTLLDHWEAARTNPQLIDIGDCIAGVIQPLAAAFPDRDVSFSQEPACYAFVDPAEIREAFGNVLDNAFKYGARAPVSVTVRKDDRDVRVVVADGGSGFSDEEKQHAFERFYRGEHRQIVGSGLGLAIAKRAVERAGGSISLESERFIGTKVTIALPRRTS